jgi:hypothetical protein
VSSRLLPALVAVLALPLAGCSMTFDATSLGVPVNMASSASAPAQGEKFSVNTTATWLFWGAVPLNTPSLKKVLARQLGGGQGVADVKIKVTSGTGGVIFSILTLGLVIPRTVHFEGVITGGPPATTAP